MTWPNLKFIWAHAGVSRRVSEATHHVMCERMLDQYPQLLLDISWCVYEDVILDPEGQPHPHWIALFEKHPTRFLIGSDVVAHFTAPNGANLLRPQIEKYWKLLDLLTPSTAALLARGNTDRLFFDGWEVPDPDRSGYLRVDPAYPCECLHKQSGRYLFLPPDQKW